MTKKEKFDYGKVLKAAFSNRPLIGVMVATIGSMLTITGSSQTYGYIYKEVYGGASLATISMACSMPFMIVIFPLIPKMVNKFGKRDVILYTAALSFAFSVVRMFIYIENVWIYTALNIMTLLGQTAFTMLIWALVSDCLDYSEWKTGFRSDGSMYSMYTFSRKIGSTSHDMALPVLQTMTKSFVAAREKPGYTWYFDRMLPGDNCGAWHSSDLWYWFGTLDNCWRPMEEKDRALSDQMVSYLCNFAKTGDPNKSAQLPTWIASDKSQPRVLILGEQPTHMGKPNMLKMVFTMLTNKAVGE